MATKTQFIAALQENLTEEEGFDGITKKQAAGIYDVFVATMFEELTVPGGKVPITGLCNLTNKEVPAKEARMGRNPATGEEMEISAKGPSVKLRMSQLKAHREAAAERFEEAQKKMSRRKKKPVSKARTSTATKKPAGKKSAGKKPNPGRTKRRRR